MSHVRTGVRLAVRDALVVALPDVDWRSDWWTRCTASQLPRGGVGTPRSSDTRIDTDGVARVIDLVVLIKRAGGADLEAVLDTDSVLIEEAVLPVLAGRADDYYLAETKIDVDAAGELPIGELSLLFRVEIHTDEGVPD